METIYWGDGCHITTDERKWFINYEVGIADEQKRHEITQEEAEKAQENGDYAWEIIGKYRNLEAIARFKKTAIEAVEKLSGLADMEKEKLI